MSSYIDVISQGNTAAAAGVKNEINSKTSMGKEDFLTLLVTQLQNQDPLNPDNPTEFTAQLAQFSSLEQLFTLNESMNDLVTSNAASDKFSSLNTIGKEVAYQSDSFNFSGESREIGYQLDSPATEITLELQQNGTTIATLQGTELTKGSHFILWDGLTTSGAPAPVGSYKIRINTKSIDGESAAALPLIRSEVTGVDLAGESGGILITLDGETNYGDIVGIYNPGSEAGSGQGEEEEMSESTLETVASLTEDVKEIME
ncbi:MAG: flagellar hook assembly protein FlgD [Deltaproteobacteria bacterium]|nr:flagellar hook assembly protein FlgD [Deltaproteobacteria bacterium]